MTRGTEAFQAGDSVARTQPVPKYKLHVPLFIRNKDGTVLRSPAAGSFVLLLHQGITPAKKRGAIYGVLLKSQQLSIIICICTAEI